MTPTGVTPDLHESHRQKIKCGHRNVISGGMSLRKIGCHFVSRPIIEKRVLPVVSAVASKLKIFSKPRAL